jgi:integrase
LPNLGKRTIYWDTTLPGFGIRIGKRTKNFVIMYGQSRNLKTIGNWPSVSLKDARTEAKRLQGQGKLDNRSMSLSDARRAYLDDIALSVAPKTRSEYHRHLVSGPDKAIGDITRNDLKLDTPHAIKAWKVFFNWCIRQEIIDKNPVQFIPVKHGKRDRVLTPEEINTLWHYEHTPYTNILKLLLLTGQRRSQIWKLQPGWIESGVIKFPAEIMKQGDAHTIPYGPLTASLLPKAPFSFNGWSKAKVRCDKHIGITSWTPHDLRRTFATIHAQLGTPIHVVEAYLNHTSGTVSGVAAIYIRHDFMEAMSEAVLKYEDQIRNIIAP